MVAVTFPSGAELEIVPGPVARHEEHWDPKSTGNPLLDVSVRDRRLSPDFTVGEIALSGSHRFEIARIDPRLIEALQALRDFVGSSVRVTSGYRSWGYNDAIYRRRGKTPTKSRHCCGQAADIRIPGLSGLEMAKAAIDACGIDIAVGIDHQSAHIDVRGRFTYWTYLDREDNRRVRKEIRAYRRLRKKQPLQPGDVGPPVDGSRPEIDVARAVERNRHHGSELGWASSMDAITDLLDIADEGSSEEVFAEAVADWQHRHALLVDGILGPITWSRIQPDLDDPRMGRPGV